MDWYEIVSILGAIASIIALFVALAAKKQVSKIRSEITANVGQTQEVSGSGNRVAGRDYQENAG